MVEFFKLKTIPRIKRLKKVILFLQEIEQCLVDNKPHDLANKFYIKQLIDVVALELPSDLNNRWKLFFDSDGQAVELKLINDTRHFLLNLTGEIPSEWDLILPRARAYTKDINRKTFSDIYLYAESIRSPFNLGSLFRTADAFGVQKVFLSPDCVSPDQARAKRSAMGCIDFVEHESLALPDVLARLPKSLPVLALETGGQNINEFQFPPRGIILIGSEELGLSAEALSLCTSRLTIPMHGIKASINLGVAFGIAMHLWTSSLTK